MLKVYDNLLNYDATIAKDLFNGLNHPWEVLPLLKDYIIKLISNTNHKLIISNKDLAKRKHRWSALPNNTNQSNFEKILRAKN